MPISITNDHLYHVCKPGHYYDLTRFCKLNLAKCHSISFTKNRTKINFNYSLHNYSLNIFTAVRDLGVIFDSSLHFDIHIDSVINRALQMYGFVMRSSVDFVRPSTYLLLYKTLVRSQLEYATSIWNPIYKKYSDRIESVQRKFLRVMNYKCRNFKVSYAAMLQRYNILSLESRRRLLGTMVLYNICNNII